MILVIPIPRPPVTANQARSRGWRGTATAKKDVAQMVQLIAGQQKVPALGPTHVEVIWFAPDMRKRDVDSLGVFVKAALDSLVKYGAWKDDDWTQVPAVTMRIQIDRGNPRIEIHLREVGKP